MENKEFFEEELCEAVELVSMLEKLSASTSADEFPVAGVQLTLAQIRKKLLSLMAECRTELSGQELNGAHQPKPVFSSKQHGISLSERIQKVPPATEKNQNGSHIRELLGAEPKKKGVINY